MKQQLKISKSFLKLIYLLSASCILFACSDDDVDDTYARYQYNLELTASSYDVVLNEDTPDDIALTLQWAPATDLGDDYILTYVYQADLVGKKPSGAAGAIKEYEDDGVFKRSYTHRELQELLVDQWNQLTSTTASIQFTVTATNEGPKLIIPEIGTISVKLRTYGPIQFLASKVFMSGSAIGDNDVEIPVSATNDQLFVYNGYLSAGTINLPVVYSDDVKINAICPTTAEEVTTGDPMEATIQPKASAGVWRVNESGDYRVTVNMENKTVTIIAAADIIEVDKIYMAGTAVGSEIEVEQTLEDEAVYAFRGQLSAGTLYLPILFDGAKARSIVPKSNSHDVSDGNAVVFGQADTEDAIAGKYWNIPTAGVYRIVVNIDTKMITIYSPATDPQPKEVSWNNTVAGVNPFVSKIEALWMYGGFNEWKGDGSSPTEVGFSEKYKLIQSTASPYIFVYKGDALPRLKEGGSVKFCVSNVKNNTYAYAANAAKNNNLSVVHNVTYTTYEGQSDNRYSYFLVPEKTNYIVVNIEKQTVVFGNK